MGGSRGGGPNGDVPRRRPVRRGHPPRVPPPRSPPSWLRSRAGCRSSRSAGHRRRGRAHLDVLATTESLGPLRGQEVELPGELATASPPGPRASTTRSSVPGSASFDESAGPRWWRSARAGHLHRRSPPHHPSRVVGLRPTNVGHVGSGLSAHSSAARDFESLAWSGARPGSTRWRARPAASACAAQVAGPGTARNNAAVVLAADASGSCARPDPDGVRRVLLEAWVVAPPRPSARPRTR